MQNQEHKQITGSLVLKAGKMRGCSECIRIYVSRLKGTFILSKDLLLLHQTKCPLAGSPVSWSDTGRNLGNKAGD